MDRFLFWLWALLPILAPRSVAYLDVTLEWDEWSQEHAVSTTLQMVRLMLHRASPRTMRYFAHRCPKLAAFKAKWDVIEVRNKAARVEAYERLGIGR